MERTGAPLRRPVTIVAVSSASNTACLNVAGTGHSSADKKRVPTWIPCAPIAYIATTPRPSPTPPAPNTGMLTALTTCGTKHMVVVSPTCPPASVPSATIASAPKASIFCACFTDATTGITLIPASLNFGMNGLGVPAPVVTTVIPSSITTSTNSGQLCIINIKFTANGLSVMLLHF